MKKRILSVILILILIICTIPTSAVAQGKSPFDDTTGHWSEELLIEKYNKGLVKGYPNGCYKPDGYLTRSELVTLINRSFGLSMTSENQYEDIMGTEWYKDEANKAYYYQYVMDNNIRANDNATRIEAVMMIGSLIKIDVDAKKDAFDDTDELTSKERNMINMFAQMDYLQGDGDNTVKPNRNLTRAEILTMLDNVLGYVVASQEDVENIPETGRVTIIGKNIVIDNKKIEDLYISPGVNTKVIIKNTTIKNNIEVACEGSLVLEGTLVEHDSIIRKGQLELINASLNDVIIKGKSDIVTDEDTIIKDLDIYEGVNIKGKGDIKKAYVKYDGVVIETKPKYIRVSSGITSDVKGKALTSRNDDYRRSSHSSISSGGGGATPATAMQGKGTADEPYLIASVEDLVAIGTDEDDEYGDDGVKYALTCYYKLVNNLDFADDASYEDANGKDSHDVDDDLDKDETLKHALTDKTGKGFRPIGKIGARDGSYNDYGSFQGQFDGNGKTISNIYINRSDSDRIGLFGSTWVNENKNTCIKNLGLLDIDITGKENVGGILGSNQYAVIENCYTTGSVTGKTKVGGVAGDNSGDFPPATIRRCYSSANITAIGTGNGGRMQPPMDGYAGGILGKNECIIEDCYATGDVTGHKAIGGLVGKNGNGKTIRNCYATGNVSGTNYVGGVVGFNGSNSKIANTIAFNDSVSAVEEYEGRVIGFNSSGTIICEFNNYANIGMTGGGALKTLDGNDGEDITLEQFVITNINGNNIPDFFEDLNNWKTDEGFTLWNFNDVWKVDSIANKIKL